MQILIFANLKEKKMLQEIMDWSKKTKHIKFQMTFINKEARLKRFLVGYNPDLIVVLNDPKVAKILKNMKKRFVVAKDNWYKGLKSYENR